MQHDQIAKFHLPNETVAYWILSKQPKLTQLPFNTSHEKVVSMSNLGIVTRIDFADKLQFVLHTMAQSRVILFGECLYGTVPFLLQDHAPLHLLLLWISFLDRKLSQYDWQCSIYHFRREWMQETMKYVDSLQTFDYYSTNHLHDPNQIYTIGGIITSSLFKGVKSVVSSVINKWTQPPAQQLCHQLLGNNSIVFHALEHELLPMQPLDQLAIPKQQLVLDQKAQRVKTFMKQLFPDG